MSVSELIDDQGPVDAAVSFWLQKVIEANCDDVERAKIRLAMSMPSKELEETLEAASEDLAVAFDQYAITVLNKILFPDDD